MEQVNFSLPISFKISNSESIAEVNLTSLMYKTCIQLFNHHHFSNWLSLVFLRPGLVFTKWLSQGLGLNSILLQWRFKSKGFGEYDPWIEGLIRKMWVEIVWRFSLKWSVIWYIVKMSYMLKLHKNMTSMMSWITYGYLICTSLSTILRRDLWTKLKG